MTILIDRRARPVVWAMLEFSSAQPLLRWVGGKRGLAERPVQIAGADGEVVGPFDIPKLGEILH